MCHPHFRDLWYTTLPEDADSPYLREKKKETYKDLRENNQCNFPPLTFYTQPSFLNCGFQKFVLHWMLHFIIMIFWKLVRLLLVLLESRQTSLLFLCVGVCVHANVYMSYIYFLIDNNLFYVLWKLKQLKPYNKNCNVSVKIPSCWSYIGSLKIVVAWTQ